MPIPVTIPRLGWNMEEGVFVEWLKADGETVKPGDAVFRLEGEKATEDVETLDAGTLHIPADGPKTGDRLAVGATIGFLLQAGKTPEAIRRAGGVPTNKANPGLAAGGELPCPASVAPLPLRAGFAQEQGADAPRA